MTDAMALFLLKEDEIESRLLELIEEYPPDRLFALEHFIRRLSGKVIIKLAARKEVARLVGAELDDRLSAVRGWLFKKFDEMELSAKSERNCIRTQKRVRYGDLLSIGVTVNRREGETLYYIANIYHRKNYQPHPIESFRGEIQSYCGKCKQTACDRMARSLLGAAINYGLNDEELFLIINKKLDLPSRFYAPEVD